MKLSKSHYFGTEEGMALRAAHIEQAAIQNSKKKAGEELIKISCPVGKNYPGCYKFAKARKKELTAYREAGAEAPIGSNIEGCSYFIPTAETFKAVNGREPILPAIKEEKDETIWVSPYDPRCLDIGYGRKVYGYVRNGVLVEEHRQKTSDGGRSVSSTANWRGGWRNGYYKTRKQMSMDFCSSYCSIIAWQRGYDFNNIEKIYKVRGFSRKQGKVATQTIFNCAGKGNSSSQTIWAILKGIPSLEREDAGLLYRSIIKSIKLYFPGYLENPFAAAELSALEASIQKAFYFEMIKLGAGPCTEIISDEIIFDARHRNKAKKALRNICSEMKMMIKVKFKEDGVTEEFTPSTYNLIKTPLSSSILPHIFSGVSVFVDRLLEAVFEPSNNQTPLNSGSDPPILSCQDHFFKKKADINQSSLAAAVLY